MAVLEMTMDERQTVLQIIARNGGISGRNKSPAGPRQDVSCTGKENKKVIQKIVRQVDQSLDARKNAAIHAGHKKSGYSDYQIRLNGSYGSNSR